MTSFKILQYFPFPYKRKRNGLSRYHHANDSSDSSHNNQHQNDNTINLGHHGTLVTKCTNPAMIAYRSSFLKKPKIIKQKNQVSSFLLPSLYHNDTKSYSSKVARLNKLPYELLIHIMTYLDLPSILTLSYTSKFYYCLCGKSNNDLWHFLYRLTFHTATEVENTNSASSCYYYYYRDRQLLGKRWQTGNAQSHYLIGHEDSVYCLAWINNHQVLSGSRDQSIKLWDVNRRECLMTQQHQQRGSVLCIKVALDGSFFISGSSDATLIYWTLPDMIPQWQLKGHLKGVLDVCLVMQGNNGDGWIVSSSRDTTVKVWNVNNGQPVHGLFGHHGPVNALEHIKYTTQIISASGDTTLKLWDVITGQCLRTFFGHDRGLACVSYDPCLDQVISGGQDGKIKIWDLKSANCLQTMNGHADLIRTIDNFQGNLVVSGSYDRTIRVWDASTGTRLLTFHSGHSSWIFNVLVSNTKIISAGQDKKIMILDFGYDLETI